MSEISLLVIKAVQDINVYYMICDKITDLGYIPGRTLYLMDDDTYYITLRYDLDWHLKFIYKKIYSGYYVDGKVISEDDLILTNDNIIMKCII